MSSAQSSSDPQPVKIEADDEEPQVVPTMSKEAFEDAMNMDLPAWRDKWQIAQSAGKIIDITGEEEEEEQPGQATAAPTEDDKTTWRQAQKPWRGRSKRKRGGGGRQKREWQQWREQRNGPLLAQQYRERVAATRALHEAARRAATMYSPEALQESRAAAIQQWPPAPPPKRRTWTQIPRPQEENQQQHNWDEPPQTGSPMHPNPRAHIWPTVAPAGLQSKSRGAPPVTGGRTIVELTAAGIRTPATPPPPEPNIEGASASAPPVAKAQMPASRVDAMQGILTSMAALLGP